VDEGVPSLGSAPHQRTPVAAMSTIVGTVANHAAMVSLHFMAYNFARPHAAPGKNRTPAMRLAWRITFGPCRRSRAAR
jgi:hypothetical protein